MQLRLFSAREGDDYRQVLKGRCFLFTVFIVLGLATLGVSLFLAIFDILGDSLSYAIGFYAGVGSGVAIACLVGLIGTRKLIKNEQKMRTEFIKETDEREKEVTLRAASFTALVLIAVAYVAMMVSVVLNRTVFNTLLAVAVVFFVVFLSSRAYYAKKL